MGTSTTAYELQQAVIDAALRLCDEEGTRTQCFSTASKEFQSDLEALKEAVRAYKAAKEAVRAYKAARL